jgi:hypothetical protein
MVSIMIFTAPVRNILDTPSYVQTCFGDLLLNPIRISNRIIDGWVNGDKETGINNGK